MNLSEFIRIIVRSWWILVIVLTAVLASTFYFISKEKTVYRASSTLVVGLSDLMTSIPLPIVFDSFEVLESRTMIATYAKILGSRTTQAQARAKLGLSPNQMSHYRISTRVIPDTNIISVSVEGYDPKVVMEMSNTIADLAQNNTKDLYLIFKLTVIDHATESSVQANSHVKRKLGVGLVFGLLAGLGFVFAYEYVRKAIYPTNK